ncbi:MAG: hypothetical protein KIS80_05560 [Anaerolineales bacterium]|nr:hypothetical protein [Anaerolineales bacterium]
MLSGKALGRFGGIIATLSLIFLPLASCGDTQFHALDVFQAENSEGHKILLFVALVAAVAAVAFVQRNAQIVSGMAGVAAIGLEYSSSLRDPERLVQLLVGTHLAFFGFLLVLAAGLFTQPGRQAKG